MKTLSPISLINSLQEQLADAVQDKDPCAAALFEDFIDQTIEAYSLKTCECCKDVYEGRGDYCPQCETEGESQYESDFKDYISTRG